MLDKRYWVAKCRHGEIGFSTFATTKEDFEEQCKNHPHTKEGEGCAIESKEISQDEFAARVRAMPAWIKETIKLRRSATKKVFPTLKDIKPSEISAATILGWRLRLSVDLTEKRPKFHLSGKPLRGRDATEAEMVKLGQIIQVLGNVSMPELMLKSEAYHFEWNAPDVDFEAGAEVTN
jgi:hypothetical protein